MLLLLLLVPPRLADKPTMMCWRGSNSCVHHAVALRCKCHSIQNVINHP